MSKSFLVIETPESCSKCPLFNDFYSDMYCKGLNNRGINYPYPEDFKQSWCPLIAAPKKNYDGFLNDWEKGYKAGYNACINEILGGK